MRWRRGGRSQQHSRMALYTPRTFKLRHMTQFLLCNPPSLFRTQFKLISDEAIMYAVHTSVYRCEVRERMLGDAIWPQIYMRGTVRQSPESAQSPCEIIFGTEFSICCQGRVVKRCQVAQQRIQGCEFLSNPIPRKLIQIF